MQLEIVECEHDEPVHQPAGDSSPAHLGSDGETADLAEFVLGQDRHLGVRNDGLGGAGHGRDQVADSRDVTAIHPFHSYIRSGTVRRPSVRTKRYNLAFLRVMR
jgi:hypothetical protein